LGPYPTNGFFATAADTLKLVRSRKDITAPANTINSNPNLARRLGAVEFLFIGILL
jgi:hypothetical protein